MADIEQLRLEVSGLKEVNRKLTTALLSKEVDPEGNICINMPIGSATNESYKMVISEAPGGAKVFKIDVSGLPAYSALTPLETDKPDDALRRANTRYYTLNQILIKKVQTQAKTIKALDRLSGDKLGFIAEIKRLTAENAETKKCAEHMEAHCKESSLQLEQLRQQCKDAKNAKDAGKQKAADTAAAANLRAQKTLKAAHDVNDILRGELVAASATIESLEARAKNDRAALAKKVADLVAENTSQAKDLELQHTNSIGMQIQIAALEKYTEGLLTQIAALHALRNNHANKDGAVEPERVKIVHQEVIDTLRTTTADLLKKIEEQETIEDSLNSALQLHIAESAAQQHMLKHYIETLRGELHAMRVKKITEANEHTAVLTYMLITGQPYLSGVGYMCPSA